MNTGIQRTFPIKLADTNADSGDTHMAYREVHKAVNGTRGATGLPFSIADFHQGYFFTAIDLTPDGRDDLAHHYPVETGAISIFVKFRAALAYNLEMLVYGIFSETLSMNQSRQVITTLNI